MPEKNGRRGEAENWRENRNAMKKKKTILFSPFSAQGAGWQDARALKAAKMGRWRVVGREGRKKIIQNRSGIHHPVHRGFQGVGV